MSTWLETLLVTVLFGGATLACSKAEPSPTNAAAPAASALPDLAKPETWDRKDRPLRASGRARISIDKGPGAETDDRCDAGPECRCLKGYALTLEGPRQGDRVWLGAPGSPAGRREVVARCSGEGDFPQGLVEVEGTLTEGFFLLSKPPKYVDGARAAGAGKAR
jgi:hypothetical protein